MVEHIRYFRGALKGFDAMSAITSRSYPRHTHDQYGIGVIDRGGHASLSGRGQVEADPAAPHPPPALPIRAISLGCLRGSSASLPAATSHA